MFFALCSLIKINSQNETRVDRLEILSNLDYTLGDPVEIGQYNGQTLYRSSYITTGRCLPPGRLFCKKCPGCCHGGSADHLSDGYIIDVRVNGNVGQLYKGQDENEEYDVFYSND